MMTGSSKFSLPVVHWSSVGSGHNSPLCSCTMGRQQPGAARLDGVASEPSVAWLLSLKKREENGARKLSACGGCQNVPQERISERFRHRH